MSPDKENNETMSNRAMIMPTRFTDITPTCTSNVSLGCRVADDYGMSYMNHWDDIPDKPMDVLRRVIRDADATINGILDHVKETKSGIYICDVWYDWDQIKGVFNEDRD